MRGRLLFLLLAGLAIVLAAGGAAVFWIAGANMERQLDAGLEARARALSSMLIFDDGRVEFEFMDAPRASTDDGFFEFRRASGELLAHSTNVEGLSWPAHPDLERALVFRDVPLPDGRTGRAASLVFRVRLDAQYLRAGIVPPGAQEPLIVMTAVDRAPLDAALATLLGTLILVGGIVGLTAAMLVLFGQAILFWRTIVRGARYGAAVQVSHSLVRPLPRPDPWKQTVGGPGGPRYPIGGDEYGV